MAKIQLKSDSINHFLENFSILNIFNSCGLSPVITQHLGQRGMNKAAFTYDDVLTLMFVSYYLCDGDCIENAMEIKPFWNDRDNSSFTMTEVTARGDYRWHTTSHSEFFNLIYL